MILDMNENIDVPLILGQPFLATTRAILDVSDGMLVLRVGEEQVIFKISDIMRHSLELDDTFYFLNDLDITMFGFVQEVLHDNPLKLCIVQAKEEE